MLRSPEVYAYDAKTEQHNRKKGCRVRQRSDHASMTPSLGLPLTPNGSGGRGRRDVLSKNDDASLKVPVDMAVKLTGIFTSPRVGFPGCVEWMQL